jgi:hypothetical protein
VMRELLSFSTQRYTERLHRDLQSYNTEMHGDFNAKARGCKDARGANENNEFLGKNEFFELGVPT